MACDITTVCEAPCASPAFGPTSANWALAELLLAILANVSPGAEVDPDTILTDTDCLGCLTEAGAKQKQYSIICNGLSIEDCTRLHCKTPAQVEAIKLYAICSIINAINP